MTTVQDLALMITKRILPVGFLKTPQRVIGLALFIEELRTLFCQFLENSLDEAIEKRDLTIAECAELMKQFRNTSKSFDTKIIRYMIQVSETADDIIRTMTVALHYRKDRDYDRIVAEELEKKELPYNIWIEILDQKDPWFFRISTKIEKVVLTKIFETSPNSAIIIGVCNSYLERSCHSVDIMLMSLSDSSLPAKSWSELSEYFSINSVNDMPHPFVVSRYSVEKLKQIRKTFSQIKKLADDKIIQLRETENHQLETE